MLLLPSCIKDGQRSRKPAKLNPGCEQALQNVPSYMIHYFYKNLNQFPNEGGTR
jgi:hypothetical protein